MTYEHVSMSSFLFVIAYYHTNASYHNAENITRLYQSATLTTIVSLFNESIIYDVKPDVRNSEMLLATMDNALIQIQPPLRKARPYVGLPSERGYSEGVGISARFSTLISFTQINVSHLVVSDRSNFCLRIVHRVTLKTLPYAGNCTQNNKGIQNQDGIHASKIKFFFPGSLVYEKVSKRIYVTDMTEILAIDTRWLNVSVITKDLNSNKLFSVLPKVTTNSTEFLVTVNHALGTLSTHDPILRLLVGRLTAGDSDGSDTETHFNEPRAIIEMLPKVFLLADSENNKLKVIDMDMMSTSSICSGKEGHLDDDMISCQLLHPFSLCLHEEVIYIGERGTYGGGLRAITYKQTSVAETNTPYGILLLSVLGILVLLIIILLTLTRIQISRTQGPQRITQDATVGQRVSTVFKQTAVSSKISNRLKSDKKVGGQTSRLKQEKVQQLAASDSYFGTNNTSRKA